MKKPPVERGPKAKPAGLQTGLAIIIEDSFDFRIPDSIQLLKPAFSRPMAQDYRLCSAFVLM